MGEESVVLTINSGIDRRRILDYLEQERGMVLSPDGAYHLPSCAITLKPLNCENAVLNMERTLVAFAGEENACRAEQKKFRLRFLSAGG